jgi:hypothetical protein
MLQHMTTDHIIEFLVLKRKRLPLRRDELLMLQELKITAAMVITVGELICLYVCTGMRIMPSPDFQYPFSTTNRQIKPVLGVSNLHLIVYTTGTILAFKYKIYLRK